MGIHSHVAERNADRHRDDGDRRFQVAVRKSPKNRKVSSLSG
jgi:hypothetical protein